MVRSLTMLAILALPCVALGGHCRNFYHHKVVAVQAVIAPAYYATVSPGLAQEAQVRAWARDEYRQQEQLRAQPQTAPASLLAQKCAKCHKPDGSAFDLSAGMTYEQYKRFDQIFGKGIDVPTEMAALVKSLKPQELGDLKAEVVDLPMIAPPAARTEPEGELK